MPKPIEPSTKNNMAKRMDNNEGCHATGVYASKIKANTGGSAMDAMLVNRFARLIVTDSEIWGLMRGLDGVGVDI